MSLRLVSRGCRVTWITSVKTRTSKNSFRTQERWSWTLNPYYHLPSLLPQSALIGSIDTDQLWTHLQWINNLNLPDPHSVTCLPKALYLSLILTSDFYPTLISISSRKGWEFPIRLLYFQFDSISSSFQKKDRGNIVRFFWVPHSY